MRTFQASRNTLIGTAAVALIAALSARPAAAQMATTPHDNGADCASAGSGATN